MEAKIKRVRNKRGIRYNIIVLLFIGVAALQIWTLKTFYKETKFEFPKEMFKSSIKWPISEITTGRKTKAVDMEAANAENLTESGKSSSQTGSTADSSQTMTAEGSESAQTTISSDSTAFELSDIQKKIILRLMKLPEEDIVYQYQVYSETGYPNDKNWISTDVVSVVLKDCGYDLMELIYKDMTDHIDAYPMDKKGSKTPDKKSDFRIVYIQQKFFQRNALELPVDFNADDPANLLQWQPGDIVYFQIDEENPGKDVAGMISNQKNDKGVPLVIMITQELGKVSETDALSTLKVSGHYRYPYPELNQ